MLAALRDAALDRGSVALVAPVRPIGRWLRTHEQLGGKIIGRCEHSQRFEGTWDEWETWTGLRLPSRGRVPVDGAIGDLELRDGRGTLVEPAVWVAHEA